MKIKVKDGKVNIDFEGDTITSTNDIVIDEICNDNSVDVEISNGLFVGNENCIGHKKATNILSYKKGRLEITKWSAKDIENAIKYHIEEGTYPDNINDFDDYMKQWKERKL